MVESNNELPEWAAEILKTLPPLLGVEVAAKSAGVSTKTIRRLVTRGEVPSIRVGDRVLIPRLELVKFLASAKPHAAVISRSERV